MNGLLAGGSCLLAAAGVTTYGALWPRSQLFGPTICRTDARKKLAVTFDDGPNPAITPKLLEVLERHHARATFFLIGRFVRECPALVGELVARGHVLGNHTETHPNLFWKSGREIRAELGACQDRIAETTGRPPRWFRPPYGFRNPMLAAAARDLNLTVVMWTRMPGDWSGKPASWLVERMRPVAAPAGGGPGDTPDREAGGEILCLHDGSHKALNGDRLATVQALEYWLPRWSDLGLEFVTIEDAVSTPA